MINGKDNGLAGDLWKDHNCMAKKSKLYSHFSIDQESCQVQSKSVFSLYIITNVLKNLPVSTFFPILNVMD